jgi:hypothetical protein
MTTSEQRGADVFDIRDAFFFGGLAIAAIGGAFISWPWTLVIVGAVLTLKSHGPLVITRSGGT